MKLISWNVNGIRAISKKGFAEFLKLEKPDIIGLQEIKMDHVARKKHVFDHEGYEEYWNPAKRRGYSGTATLVKNYELRITNNEKKSSLGRGGESAGRSWFREIDVSRDFNDTEGRIQVLEFEHFFFINTYFPNAQGELKRLDFKCDFNRKYLKLAKKLDKKKPVIMCGDFNVAHQPIDLTNPKSNEGSAGYTEEERKWMSKFNQAGFIDTFRHLHPKDVKYSWWSYRFQARSKNIGWRIDYFLVSERLLPKLQKAFIMDNVSGSDHCPVGIEINF